MTATPTTTTDAEWARLDLCGICSAAAGRPCTNLGEDPPTERHRPHAQRTARADRTPGGELLLGSWLYGAAAETAGSSWQAAMHVAVGGVAVCCGADLARVTMSPLDEVPRATRCRRPSCKRIWAAEAWR